MLKSRLLVVATLLASLLSVLLTAGCGSDSDAEKFAPVIAYSLNDQGAVTTNPPPHELDPDQLFVSVRLTVTASAAFKGAEISLKCVGCKDKESTPTTSERLKGSGGAVSVEALYLGLKPKTYALFLDRNDGKGPQDTNGRLTITKKGK